MKWFVFIMLTSLAFVLNRIANAEIKNGYEEEIKLADLSVRNLNWAISLNDDPGLTKELTMYLRKIQGRSNDVHRKYLLTQRMLKKFRAVTPNIYNEVNGICDREGNTTDVYVRIVDPGEFPMAGIAASTNLAHSEHSWDVYSSEYGDRSISVKVTYTGELSTLRNLAHEFGHVKYLVPNLFSYLEYFTRNYLVSYNNDISRGHKGNDPCHKSVLVTLKQFRKSWNNFIWGSKVKEEKLSADFFADKQTSMQNF